MEGAERTPSMAPVQEGMTNAQNGAADPEGCVDKPCPAIHSSSTSLQTQCGARLCRRNEPGLSLEQSGAGMGCAGMLGIHPHQRA